MKHKICQLTLVLAVIMACITSAFAAGTGSIFVNYPAKGAELAVYRVANYDGTLSSDFSGSNVDLTAASTTAQEQTAAGQLAQYAARNSLNAVRVPETYTLNGLEEGVYLLVQVKAAPGYSDMAATLIVLTDGTAVTVNPKVYNAGTPSNPSDTKISIKVEKEWDDGDDADGIRPSGVTVHLLSNGTVIRTVTLTANMNWRYTFSDLSKQKNYTVEEEPAAGYISSVTGSAAAGFVITNTHTPENPQKPKSKITVVKKWAEDGSHPDSVSVQLLENGNSVKTAVLNENNNWTVTFSELDANKTYTVSEIAVNGYSASYSYAGDVCTVTNTKTDQPVPQKPGGKIPQTGQITWPITALACGGSVLIGYGIICGIREKKRKQK